MEIYDEIAESMNYKFTENKMKIEIIKGDITKIKADAIVNAANEALMPGGGVDGAITSAAGSEVLYKRMKIGGCKTGKAVIGPAGNLDAKFIIYTVGPRKSDYKPQLLVDAYYNSIKLAIENGCESIAFPAISAGVFGFSGIESAQSAAKAIALLKNENINVTFVLFTIDVYIAFIKQFQGVTNVKILGKL